MIRDFLNSLCGARDPSRLLFLAISGWLLLGPVAIAHGQEESTAPPLDPETVERLKELQIRPEGSGYQFSVEPAPAPVPRMHLQLKAVARTDLAICPAVGDCPDGPWIQEIRIDSGASHGRRKLRWTSSGSGPIEGTWQVANQPFSEGPGMQVSQVLAEGSAGSLDGGAAVFQIDFHTLPTSPPTGGTRLRPTTPTLTRKSQAFRTFYLRVLATAGGRAVGSPSKPVVVHVGPRPPAFALGGQTLLAMTTTAGKPGTEVRNWSLGENEVHVGRSGNTTRWFRWASTSLAASEAVWQVSRTPFTESLGLESTGIRSAGSAGKIAEGRVQLKGVSYRGWQEFPVDIATLEAAAAPPAEAAGGWTRQNLSRSMELKRTAFSQAGRIQRAAVPEQWKDWFLAEFYYIRVVPMAGGMPAGSPSNSIPIRFGVPAPSRESEYRISTPPDIFALDFEFSPVKRATMGWGCIQVKSVAPGLLEHVDSPVIGPQILALVQASQTGAPICPEPYERPWYFSFWDFVSDVVDRISNAFSAVKNAVVTVLAEAIPGDLCDSTCRAAMMMGLNAGLVALGIPPEIPSLSQLTEQGMDYLVETAVAEGPVGCGLPCREAVRAGIELFAEETRRSVVQSYQDEEVAHSLGFEPIWIPPGVHAVPHPDSGDQPGKLTLRVTRRPESGNVEPELMRRYLLDLRFACRNDSAVGREVAITFCCQQYGSDCFECPGGYLRLERPIEGNLFNPISVPIPPLSPGQSVVMPMILEPADFWIPERVAEIHRVGGFVKYNDWQILYEGGSLTITASIQDDLYPEGIRHQHIIGVPVEETVLLKKIR